MPSCALDKKLLYNSVVPLLFLASIRFFGSRSTFLVCSLLYPTLQSNAPLSCRCVFLGMSTVLNLFPVAASQILLSTFSRKPPLCPTCLPKLLTHAALPVRPATCSAVSEIIAFSTDTEDLECFTCPAGRAPNVDRCDACPLGGCILRYSPIRMYV